MFDVPATTPWTVSVCATGAAASTGPNRNDDNALSDRLDPFAKTYGTVAVTAVAETFNSVAHRTPVASLASAASTQPSAPTVSFEGAPEPSPTMSSPFTKLSISEISTVAPREDVGMPAPNAI